MRAAGLYTTRGAKGGHGGKVRFPPCSMCMAFTQKQSAFPLSGRALCAMPIPRAELPCANSNTRGERGSRGKSKVSPVLHVHGFLQKAKRIPTGWQCALRRADTVSNADTDGYGKVRINTDWGTGGSESHVLRKFHSTWRSCWAELPCANSNTRAKGGHGGKVRVPPCSMCMAFTQKQSAFPLAGGAHCAMHRVGAEKWDL